MTPSSDLGSRSDMSNLSNLSSLARGNDQVLKPGNYLLVTYHVEVLGDSLYQLAGRVVVLI